MFTASIRILAYSLRQHHYQCIANRKSRGTQSNSMMYQVMKKWARNASTINAVRGPRAALVYIPTGTFLSCDCIRLQLPLMSCTLHDRPSRLRTYHIYKKNRTALTQSSQHQPFTSHGVRVRSLQSGLAILRLQGLPCSSLYSRPRTALRSSKTIQRHNCVEVLQQHYC